MSLIRHSMTKQLKSRSLLPKAQAKKEKKERKPSPKLAGSSAFARSRSPGSSVRTRREKREKDASRRSSTATRRTMRRIISTTRAS